MNVAVIGTGAIGSLLAGLFSRAGFLVCMVARSNQIPALTRDGFSIKTPAFEYQCHLPVDHTLRHEHELVIFTTQLHDLEQAYQDNHQYLESCLMMTVQSGIQGANLLSCHFEPENIIESAVLFEVEEQGLGRVHVPRPGALMIGKPFAPNDEQAYAILDRLRPHWDVQMTTEIVNIKWLRLLSDFIYCLPAITGQTLGAVYADAGMSEVFVRLLQEALEIIRVAGIPMTTLPDLEIEEVMRFHGMPHPEAKDLIADTFLHNRRLDSRGYLYEQITQRGLCEIDFINGEVVQVAHSLRMHAPMNQLCMDLVHTVEQHKRFLSFQDVENRFTSFYHPDERATPS